MFFKAFVQKPPFLSSDDFGRRHDGQNGTSLVQAELLVNTSLVALLSTHQTGIILSNNTGEKNVWMQSWKLSTNFDIVEQVLLKASCL